VAAGVGREAAQHAHDHESEQWSASQACNKPISRLECGMDHVKNHRATHTQIPTCSARREQCDGTHALAPPRPHNARRLIHALRFFRHAIMRTPCTTAHGIAGQHVGGRGRSRVRSNGAEPYLIACGVHGGAGGATAEVGGENCARGATAEGRVGGRQQRTAWRHVGGRASSRARSDGNQP
jgi:hypothetical protein